MASAKLPKGQNTGSKFKSKVVAPRNPKLIRDNDEDVNKQTTSAFMAEMALTTDERLSQTHEMRIPQIIELLDMSDTTHQKFTTLDVEEPLFQPFPSEVVFQNYEPFETYTIPLHLRNNDKVARLVKVTQADSPYFKIISPPDVGHKVAPGMDTIFLIKFVPDEKKDYTHELVCITEREKFLVPVKAIGARAILDFPDEVNFKSCPVKYDSTKTLLVRNVGNRNAKFKLITEEPFTASPNSCALGIAEIIQVDITFKPLTTGDFESNMIISYDTGEEIYVTMYGNANDMNVRLDKNTIKLDNTYITSASQRTVSIWNRSDIIVHYEWKSLATLAEELQQKQRFYQELSYKEGEQRDAFLEECVSDVSLRDKLSLVTRSFKNRIKVAEGEKMLYDDDIISLEPSEGDIWPNTHADVSIVFKPDEAKSYARTIYCDVTGRESRLPLRIRGEGIGANIEFSFDELDIGNIFVNSEHGYEVIMKNSGDIDAVFSYIDSETLFGQQFVFAPTEGIVMPGGYQAIQMQFTSPYLGEFVQDFFWMVEGSPQKFKFTIRGTVIGPTFHFDTPTLRFNTISYGFTHVATCRLINTSLIPMTFFLRVPSDGKGPSAASIANRFIEDDRVMVEETRLHLLPKEFDIFPESGNLDPQSEIEIQVHLTSLREQKYETDLVVDVEGVGKQILSLPILASSVVPAITIETPILDYGRCFIRYPYEQMVVLKNETDLPAKYELLDQVADDRSAIQYSSHYTKGIIQPQALIEIPLQISAHGMGNLLTTALFVVHGCTDVPLPVQLSCIGEGPVVHVSALDIDFGAIPVLEDATQYIRLSNESLIPAECFCEMVRPNSLFNVQPSSGIIPAEHTMTIAVTANVDDCSKFQDKLRIAVTDGQLHTIQLSAHGIGTTIVSDPPMAPTINIGATFSSRQCTRKFKLTNKGRRSQQIFWSTEGFPLVRSKKKQERNKDDIKYQRMPPTPEPPRPIFRLKPDRMSLCPGQSQEVILEGYSHKPVQVKERMICHAIVGSNTGKEKVMKVDVFAEFIEPLVQFSERKVSFFVMKHPHTKLVKELKELLFGNVSKLPLRMLLNVEYPFQLLQHENSAETTQMTLNLGVNDSLPIIVQFDPEYKDDSFCRSASSDLEITYEDHSNKDIIELKGDVYYPNLTFETEVVDFGCVLNDTEHIKYVTVTNSSPLKVEFKWSFQENAINFEGKDDDEGLGREMSDGEDDLRSKANMQSSSGMAQPYSADAEGRPKTSPAISHLPILMRPRTAPDSAMSTDQQTPLLPWMPRIAGSIGIQEVFDILPLYGELEPGETQQFQFTFYGHSHSMAEVIAVCSVYGGPDYRIHLKGQASLLQYAFSYTHIELGKQIYNQIVTTEIILFNRGKVTFDFTVMDTDRGTSPQPGGITVNPTQGSVEAQQSQRLLIRHIPGFPDAFQKQFCIRVGHFDPEVITITGEGIFPRIKFDLERDVDDPRHCKYLEKAKDVHNAKGKEASQSTLVGSQDAIEDVEDLIQEEVDRLQVKDFANELLNQEQQHFIGTILNTTSTKGSKRLKPRPQLSDYVLDFGYVVYGAVKSQTGQLKNPGCTPVSFIAEKRGLAVTGFSLSLDRVRDLPEGEAIDFNVSFDPEAANLSLGPVETVVPVKITNGPVIGLRLKAHVTMPNVELSCETVDFDTVICGQCKVVTVQMYNNTHVKCEWTAEAMEEKRRKSMKKLPMHLRKKLRSEKAKPKVFEMMPPTGTLRPGQRLNVQVKFMPTEEIQYNQKIQLTIAQSSYKHYLLCKGTGVEPKIEFSDTMLNFGPVLPHAPGDELEVVVKNTASFPVEFYSLEFDKKYLEEEKILRAMRGYDEQNTILLPPRDPGEDLPKELYDSYNEMKKKKEESDFAKQQVDDNAVADTDTDDAEASLAQGEKNFNDARSEDEVESDKEDSEYGVGELEITPISAAIARHLGIDLSAEGRAARNRRGIAIIVHGAPLAGKTATATALAEKYQAVALRVDDIVKEAIANGTSSSAIRARELSLVAARNAVSENDQGGLLQGASNDTVNSLSGAHPTGAMAGGPSATGALHAGFKESRKTTQPTMKQHKNAHISPPSTPPLGPPQPRKLSIPKADGDKEFYSCVLPDDLLVEVVSEKLQSSECQMGVVFDGLESIFASNMTSCVNALLRAINNRKYIFAVTLKLNKERLKYLEEKKKEQAAKAAEREKEAERIRLDEMSEGEYEALSEEERAEIDRKRLEVKKQRMKKKETEELREREIREERLQEEKRLEEERMPNKKKRAAGSQGNARKGQEKDVKEKKHEKSSDRLTVTREAANKDKQNEYASNRMATSGNISERSESVEDTDRKRGVVSRSARKDKDRERTQSVLGLMQIEEVVKPTAEEAREKALSQRFQAFDSSRSDIANILDAWDRTTGSVFIPESEKSDLDPESIPIPVIKKGQASHRKVDKEKEREKEKEKEREKASIKEIPGSPISAASVEHAEQSTDEEEGKTKSQIGVPTIVLQTMQPQKSMLDAVLKEQVLPGFDEVRDGLGLGPGGPPIPPSATFSVVPYPVRRKPPVLNEFGQHYVYVASAADDPNAFKDEKTLKTPDTEVERASDKKQEHRSKRARDRDDKDSVSVRASRLDRLPSGTRKGRQSSSLALAGQRSSSPPLVSPSAVDDEKSTIESSGLQCAMELVRHRWVVPASGTVKLRIRFSSQELGQFDQTLSFEIVGTRRRYQLFCRGVCCFPTISREPRIVFPHRKKYRKPEDIVQKKFILSNETYEFGPLLAGKNRDRYREGRYPENMEQICVSNTSQMEAEISFCYQNDTNGSTFLAEPVTLTLKPNESQLLNIWAYPKTPGFFEDVLVACIKENPEPVLFKVSCHGVRPELEFDKRVIQFDRVLLYRKETRVVYLRNSTLLPIAWKLSGMDNLGDDFSVTVDNGIIEPKTEFALQMHFRAIKATNIKKIVRLEVSDAANIMGLTHAENIQVLAEAYDVALDMSFPKGADGGLDFGTLRVFDESKLSCSLKNKGRYEISYNFVFEPSETAPPNIADLFTIVPNKGTLIPSDRPTQVQVVFKSKDEISIKDLPILKCQIIEPSISDSGETIAGIPVKISVRSVYSKYEIRPVKDINFGAVLINTRKTKTILIENKGEFDFRYSIVKLQNQMLPTKAKLGAQSKRSRDGSASGRSQMVSLITGQSKQKRTDSVRAPDGSGIIGGGTTGGPGGASSVRLQLGMFTIFPASGVVVPGGNPAQITVDMFSESSAICEEDIAIDITERPPYDCPGGIEYKLIGETCLPSISNLHPNNISSIFEEHRIVSNLNVFRYHAQDLEPGSGVYGEEENKFVFYNVIVGHKAKARVKIANPNKVPCDVVFSVKPVSNKPSARWTDVYEVEPHRAAIQPHSFVYATITFQPPSMQGYSAVFEAAVDGLPNAISKGRNLIFDVHGDGNLPRVSVQKPTLLSKKGIPLLLFSRLLTNRTQVLPLVLKNEGTLSCTVNMTLIDPDCSFVINKTSSTGLESISSPDAEDSSEVLLETTSSKPVMTSFIVNVGVEMNFLVEFTPSERRKISAECGIEENVLFEHSTVICAQGVVVPRNNHVSFGDCSIDVASMQSFTLTNHTESDIVRFTWDSAPPQLTFSPCTGHLLPNCAKDISVSFLNSEPFSLDKLNVPCKLTKIQLAQNYGRAGAWDDRMKIVKWIDVKADQTMVRNEDEEKQAKMQADVPSAHRPTKRKVIETEAEPPYTQVPETASEIELLFSGRADYAKYSLSTNKVFFKETLMFQTRMYSFTLKNTGTVQLDYSWSIEAGWTREPTEISQEKEEEKTPSATKANAQVQAVKSAKGSRDGSRSPKVPATPVKTATEARTTTKPGSSQAEHSRASVRGQPAADARPGSVLASASDGRPATAMALAYEAGSICSEPVGTDLMLFTIEPQYGSIKPESEATFTVRFSPLDSVHYGGTLIADISNLDKSMENPVLLLSGRSLLPWCHFELEESNYIASKRNPELKGPGGSPPGSTLEPNTKVIEFISCGVKTKTTRRFFIVNPTNTTFRYSWTNEDGLDPHKQFSGCAFSCLTPTGTIEAGKKTEIVFEYLPESMDLVESFWRFFIQDYNVSVSFLLVGMATDPAVSFDKSHLNFKEFLIGHKVVRTLNMINDEDRSFQFCFDKESCFAAGHVASLLIQPMEGVIEPRSKLPISVHFCPEIEQEVNFNLVCRVKKKTTPLTVNIKAEGFSIASKLTCEDSQGNKVALSENGMNLINLGEVELNEKVVRQLYIENLGKFNLDFSWEIKQTKKRKNQQDELPISVTPESGTVSCNTKKRCQLSFCPPCKMTLTGYELVLKIVNGLQYRLAISGSGITPSLDFSFQHHNFGPCFIHRPGLPVPKATLVIENKDLKDISFECQYKNTPHLEVVSEPGILSNGGKCEVDFLFYPRQLKTYHERVPFEINGLSMFYIDIEGQGTEMKIEVANPIDRKINLGALRIGKTSSRSVKIINNSMAPIDFTVAITPATLALQQSNIISIHPQSMISLNPKATTDVTVNFSPKSRIPQFSEEVILECAGISQPLFLLNGCCHGMEIKLDSEAVPFGTVTLGSSSSRKLIMYNTGDIGAAFCWNIEKFKPNFEISPIKGYISAGMEVSFDITFTPVKVGKEDEKCLRCDAPRCAIEGGRPLKLVLTGSYIKQTPMKETIHFQTYVRNRDTRNLTIHNKTNQTWLLKPTIDGEYWTGADTLTVDAQQGKNYEITYRPLTMTLENKKHTGTIFFALPDGSGLLYNLTGASDAPKPIGNIQRDVPCKVSFTEMLQITNWLRKPQRFRVTIEMLKPEKPDPATSLKGLDYSDVPGLSKKEYRLNFYAHREGTFSAKVTFKNEQSGEYQYYYVQFKATTPGVISTIDLSTPVRQSTSRTITVNNPLQAPVNFQTNCNLQDINLPPQFTIPPQSNGPLTFEYLPMKSGDMTARLSLQSSELGLYLYDLNLTASPANPERPVHFITTLGMNQNQTCRFTNYARSKVEYSCKVDNPEFLVERSVTAASASSGGSEVGVEVTFEPTKIGDSKATLSITSNSGGEYIFPLHGHCMAPKPLGPYTIKAGGSTAIPFKNVFPQTTSFVFHVDNPCFTVKQSETIRGKKTHNISVGFEGNQGDSKVVRMGRLVVTCVRSAGTSSNLTWTFYLKGLPI
eukprot:gene18879-20779_t